MRKGQKPNSNEWHSFMFREFGTSQFSDIARLNQNHVMDRIRNVTAKNGALYRKILSGYERDKQVWNMGASASDRI